MDYSSAAVLPRPFVEAALSEGASVAIIAHTHPYGPIIPSYYDKETNSLISSSLKDVGVVLAEHYIIVGERYAGFMQNPRLVFGQDNALEEFYESKKKGMRGDAP